MKALASALRIHRRTADGTPGRLLRLYHAVIWGAMFWAVFNCLYVYLVLAGSRTFRIESALFVLVASLLPLIVSRRSQPPGRSSLLTAAETRALLCTAAGVWLIVFLPLLTFPFLSDDFVFLDLYKEWSDVFRSPQFFRPAFAALFLMLSRTAGASPALFHLVSLLLHAVSAALVYVLASRLFHRRDAATVCFSLFLLNPLQLEAVLWASGLQESLWTVFTLSALVLYTGGQLLTIRRLLGTGALAVCALLSKETAASFVLLLPAADWVFFRMKRGPALVIAYGTFVATLIGYLVVRRRFASIESTYFVQPSMYFAKQFLVTPYKFFSQPWNLSVIHIPALVLCSVSVAAIGLLFWAVLRGAGPRILVGPAVILMSTLPLYSYFYVGPNLIAGRYLYFATFGWAVLVAEILVSTMTRPRAFLASVVGILAISFVSLQGNLRPWRTAGQIVVTMETALKQHRSVALVVEDWQRQTGYAVEVRNDVPYRYHGVGIFINGYPEFSKRISNR